MKEDGAMIRRYVIDGRTYYDFEPNIWQSMFVVHCPKCDKLMKKHSNTEKTWRCDDCNIQVGANKA